MISISGILTAGEIPSDDGVFSGGDELQLANKIAISRVTFLVPTIIHWMNLRQICSATIFIRFWLKLLRVDEDQTRRARRLQ